jgi:hypothetical protein
MGYRARNTPGNPDSYIPLDNKLGINGTTKYTNWGYTDSGRLEPAYNPGAVPPPLCLQSNYSEAQNGAGGFANWPCTFPFVFICKTMGERQCWAAAPAPCHKVCALMRGEWCMS